MLLLPSGLYAQVVNIEDQRIKGTSDSVHWYGQFELSGNLAKVKEQVLQINATAQIEYKKNRSLALFLLDGDFLRAGKKDFNNAGFVHLRYNHDLTQKLTWEAYTQAQFNKLLLIRQRTLAGSGLRARVWKDKPGKNRIYLGLAYLYEINQFLEGNESRNWHRLSSYFSATLRPWDGALLVTTTYFQPQVSHFENYRLSSEWKLVLPLHKKLTYTTAFIWGKDRSLPSDAPKTTYSWTNGLALEL